MRTTCLSIALASILLIASGCGVSRSSSTNSRNGDADSAAGRMGQAARKAAAEADRASRNMNRTLSKAAKDAQAGWKQAGTSDTNKK